MPDMALITGALASLKTATEIAKLLRESDLSLEKAELKLKLAELLGSLADAKVELARIQEVLGDKDAKIQELEAAFSFAGNMIRHRDAYYVADASGQPTGSPFCLRCWEVEHRQRQLIYAAGDHRSSLCPSCKTKYEGRMVPTIKPDAPAE